MRNMFSGTGVALVTPFNKTGDVDHDALQKVVRNVIQNKVEYLVVLGTTSEAPVLTEAEQHAVIQTIVECNEGQLPIVLGLGGNNTKSILEKIDSTDFSHIDAILSVAPYYNKPNQRGLLAHFGEIAKKSPVPVILYNVPGRTSSNLAAKTSLELAIKYSNIVGIKEASGNMEQIMELIAHKPKDFEVISGDDALTFPMLALGASGVISVAANALPHAFSTMVRTALQGDFDTARDLHYSMLTIVNLLFTEGNPAGVKALLSIQGFCENILRLPLVEVGEDTKNQLEKAWKLFIKP